jgi:hypothetical protein
MKQTIGADRSGATTAAVWQLKLDCGHELALPFGSAGPAVMACIVEHRDHCESSYPEPLAGTGWRVAALLPTPIPAFR